MKRIFGLLAAGALLVGVLGASAAAQDEPPRHRHMFVLGVEFDGEEPVGFRKCVDLAAGQALPLNAHHLHVHTGRAGEALFQAGHVVVPGAPLTPWNGCTELIDFFFGD